MCFLGAIIVRRASMSLDASTLLFAGGFVTFASGLFLLVFWWQDRAAWSAFWWALGSCFLGVGIVLLSMRGVLPASVSSVVVPQILNVSAALALAAAQIFNRGSINPYRLSTIVIVWTGVQVLAGILSYGRFADVLGLAGAGGFYIVAAIEFWLRRAERLRGRMPLIAVLALHAIALELTAVQFALASPVAFMPSLGGIGGINLVDFVYALGVMLLLPIMLKGRSEERYRQAAMTDPLTGLENRRAFVSRAQRGAGPPGRRRAPGSTARV